VVLVCKRWATLCLSNPPQQRSLTLTLKDSSAVGANTYLSWLAKCGKATHVVDLHLPTFDLSRIMVSQTLTILAITAPGLRELAIHLGHFNLDQFNKRYLQV